MQQTVTYTYFIFQIKAPGGHDTTFINSTYTINKVKYNNYFITINHVCHRLKQREDVSFRKQFGSSFQSFAPANLKDCNP
jgi:hypothetical protein